MNTKIMNVNGFDIAYLQEGSIVYLRADDVAVYFGYKKGSKGYCSQVYSEYGIGNVKGSTFKYFDHIKKECKAWKPSMLGEVAKASNKYGGLLVHKIKDLKQVLSKEVKNAKTLSRETQNSFTEKLVKEVTLSEEKGKLRILWDDGFEQNLKIYSSVFSKDRVCVMTQKTIKAGEEVILIQPKKKGYKQQYLCTTYAPLLASSATPYIRSSPSYLQTTTEDTEDLKISEKGFVKGIEETSEEVTNTSFTTKLKSFLGLGAT